MRGKPRILLPPFACAVSAFRPSIAAAKKNTFVLEIRNCGRVSDAHHHVNDRGGRRARADRGRRRRAGSQGRHRAALYGHRRPVRTADGPRHGDVSQAQCRRREALHDQADQARRQEPERRRLEGRGAGVAHPGQGRGDRGLGLLAERDRVGAGDQRGPPARRDHERRHRVHHQPVADLRAHLVQHVARRLRDRDRGRQAAQRKDRGRGLFRLPARQGQPGGVSHGVRGGGRQGDRRAPGRWRRAPCRTSRRSSRRRKASIPT